MTKLYEFKRDNSTVLTRLKYFTNSLEKRKEHVKILQLRCLQQSLTNCTFNVT